MRPLLSFQLSSQTRLAPPILGGLFLCLYPLCLLPGCSPRTAAVHAASPAAPPPGADVLAPGVVHRAIPLTADTGTDVIDLDLDRAQARWGVETWGIQRASGRVVGRSFTPRDWLTRLGGLAAVNGGYFGAEDGAGRKEFVGLLVQGGRVRHAAPPLHGEGSPTIRRGRYVRSAFGLASDGTPGIVWAATDTGKPQSLHTFAAPMGGRGAEWRVAQAIGCGPTLISGGKVVVTQYQERLVSPGPRARTFVAYDLADGKPRHLLVGTASGADFHALAAFLAAYFPRYDGTRAEAAMCLDGGASTQMTFRLNGALQSPRETGVTVPDALVLRPSP